MVLLGAITQHTLRRDIQSRSAKEIRKQASPPIPSCGPP